MSTRACSGSSRRWRARSTCSAAGSRSPGLAAVRTTPARTSISVAANVEHARADSVRRLGGDVMALLWLLVLLLIVFALVGGLAVSNWLFVLLVVALVLALVGYA